MPLGSLPVLTLLVMGDIKKAENRPSLTLSGLSNKGKARKLKTVQNEGIRLNRS